MVWYTSLVLLLFLAWSQLLFHLNNIVSKPIVKRFLDKRSLLVKPCRKGLWCRNMSHIGVLLLPIRSKYHSVRRIILLCGCRYLNLTLNTHSQKVRIPLYLPSFQYRLYLVQCSNPISTMRHSEGSNFLLQAYLLTLLVWSQLCTRNMQLLHTQWLQCIPVVTERLRINAIVDSRGISCTNNQNEIMRTGGYRGNGIIWSSFQLWNRGIIDLCRGNLVGHSKTGDARRDVAQFATVASYPNPTRFGPSHREALADQLGPTLKLSARAWVRGYATGEAQKVRVWANPEIYADRKVRFPYFFRFEVWKRWREYELSELMSPSPIHTIFISKHTST